VLASFVVHTQLRSRKRGMGWRRRPQNNTLNWGQLLDGPHGLIGSGEGCVGATH